MKQKRTRLGQVQTCTLSRRGKEHLGQGLLWGTLPGDSYCMSSAACLFLCLWITNTLRPGLSQGTS